MMNSIEQLDANMATAEARDGLLWYDLRHWPLEGRGWADVERHYSRLPARASNLVRPPVWSGSQLSAGLCVRFVTDAPSLSARWKLLNPALAMNHMPATGVSGLDLYMRDEGGWRWAGVGRPVSETTNTTVLAEYLPPGLREYRLYLPLWRRWMERTRPTSDSSAWPMSLSRFYAGLCQPVQNLFREE